MVDDPPAHLVVAREPGEDGQPGGVGGRPAGRPEPIRAQAPDRARAGTPAAPFRIERIELVEAAGAAVDDERMAVSRRGAPAFDLHLARDRIGAAIRLVGVLEGDARLRLPAADDGDRNSDRRALPEPRAKVRVHAGSGADRRDDLGGVARDRERVDPLIPGARLREDRAAGRSGHAQRLRGRAAERERKKAEHEDPAIHCSVIDRRRVSTKGRPSPKGWPDSLA